jgi:hypothetical protein
MIIGFGTTRKRRIARYIRNNPVKAGLCIVALTSKSAVSRVSKPAGQLQFQRPRARDGPPIWKSVIR